MRPPEFWNHKHGRDAAPVVRALLTPASMLYAWAAANKQKNAKPISAGAPVICVGNVTLGGSGKTPIVRRLREIIAERGLMAHVLLRGHGGSETGPKAVDELHDTAAQVGDEALLHARDGYTWIARDRAAGARAAVESHAPVIILDDGFQNTALRKDLSIVVFDAKSGIGNGAVFPAGPLREPLKEGLKRADLVVLMHGDLKDAAKPDWLEWDGPLVHAALAATSTPPGGPLIGFAGIGRPAKFFDSVRAAGGDLLDVFAYADHHPYTPAELADLRAHAKAHGATLITTEKDHVRLPSAARKDIAIFPVAVRFADEAPLRAALDRALEK